MVKRTKRRKNKSKRKRTKRKYVGGTVVCTPNCSNCGDEQSLCRVGQGSSDNSVNVNFQCTKCRFTVTSPLVYRIINKFSYINYNRTLDKCREEIKIVIDKLNTTKRVTEEKYPDDPYELVKNIKAVLNNTIDIGISDVQARHLIEWLPIKESDFYQSSATKLFSGITSVFS